MCVRMLLGKCFLVFAATIACHDSVHAVSLRNSDLSHSVKDVISSRQLLVLSNREKLKLLDTQSTSIPTSLIKSSFGDITALDYYIDEQEEITLVWLESRLNESKIFSGKLRADSVDEITLVASLPFVTDLTVDSFSSKPVAYLTSEHLGNLVSISLDNPSSNFTTLLDAIPKPGQIVVDPVNGSFVVFIENGECIWKYDLNVAKATKLACLQNSSNIGSLSIRSVAIDDCFCYYILSNGEIHRLALLSHTNDALNGRIITTNDYKKATSSRRYQEKSPSSLEVSRGPHGHLNVYVGDKRHGIVFYFNVTLLGESNDLISVGNDSRVLTAENNILDIKVLAPRRSHTEQLLSSHPTSTESPFLPVSTPLNNVSAQADEQLATNMSSQANETSSQLITVQQFDNYEITYIRDSFVSDSDTKQNADAFESLFKLWYMLVGGAAFAIVSIVIAAAVRCYYSPTLVRHKGDNLLVSPLDDVLIVSDTTKPQVLISRPRPRTIRSFSGRSARHSSSSVTTVRTGDVVCIEDLGGFANPAFDHCGRSGSAHIKKACDACDYKEECSERGICLSTYSLLDK